MNTTLFDLSVVPSLTNILCHHLLMKTKVCERRPMIDSVIGKLRGEERMHRGLVRVVDRTFVQ